MTPGRAIVLKRMADAGRLHKLRKGRPYHEALYARERLKTDPEAMAEAARREAKAFD